MPNSITLNCRRPYTEDTIEHLAKTGSRRLVVVPISFVSEHVETLEEIDQEYHEIAMHQGFLHWRRVPALNTDPGFIKELGDVVVSEFVVVQWCR